MNMSYDKVLSCYVDLMTYELCMNSFNTSVVTFMYVFYDHGNKIYVCVGCMKVTLSVC